MNHFFIYERKKNVRRCIKRNKKRSSIDQTYLSGQCDYKLKINIRKHRWTAEWINGENQRFFWNKHQFFIQLNEGNDNILSKIDILSENQADQLETIAQTRDTLESIVKIDLNSLKTDFNIFRNEFLSSHIQLGEKINDVTTQVKNIEKAIQNEQEKHFQLLSVLAEKMEKQGENTLTEVKKIAAYVLKKKKEEEEME